MTSTAIDLDAVKAKQRATWASGDFSAVATKLVLVAERLADETALQAGWRVLDVATGSGNAAIAAARHGTDAVGLDYVPALLERGRERAAAERLDVEFVEGDAEQLPFEQGEFDAALSVFGVMFAPRQEQAAAELARVVRPGGRIGLASWTPEGFVGEMFRTIAHHVPPPAGLPSPMRWGSEADLAELLDNTVEQLDARRLVSTWRFGSAAEFADFFRRFYGPTTKAFEAAPDAAALERDLVELAERWTNAEPGTPIAIEAEYLQAVGVRV
jgi:SAM-dependent methyltransferase